MVKNFILVIFISVLIISCDNQIVGWNNNENDNENGFYFLEIESYLEKDINGYYHMNLLNGYSQTFTTLTAKTGSYNNIQKVYWTADRTVDVNLGEEVDVVNGSSYTDELGEAHTVFSGWFEMLYDTIMVKSYFYDDFDFLYQDSLKIIVE